MHSEHRRPQIAPRSRFCQELHEGIVHARFPPSDPSPNFAAPIGHSSPVGQCGHPRWLHHPDDECQRPVQRRAGARCARADGAAKGGAGRTGEDGGAAGPPVESLGAPADQQCGSVQDVCAQPAGLHGAEQVFLPWHLCRRGAGGPRLRRTDAGVRRLAGQRRRARRLAQGRRLAFGCQPARKRKARLAPSSARWPRKARA